MNENRVIAVRHYGRLVIVYLATDEGRMSFHLEVIPMKSTFSLGKLLATPGALHALEESGECLMDYVQRHQRKDWGVVDAEDAEANNRSLQDGSRLLSVYVLKSGQRLWLITEAEDDQGKRAATTALLPSEY